MGFPDSSVGKESACNAGDPDLIWKRMNRLPTPVFLGFPCGSAGKESAGKDLGLIPGLERSPGEGKDYPLQYSGLENSMDYIVHGVIKSRTRLSDFHFTFSWASEFLLSNLLSDQLLPPTWGGISEKLQVSMNITLMKFHVGYERAFLPSVVLSRYLLVLFFVFNYLTLHQHNLVFNT